MSEESAFHNTFDGGVERLIQGRTIHVHYGPNRIPPREGPPVDGAWIGREREVERIAADIAARRPVAIHGEGGIGKTALAAQVIDHLRDRYPDGQLYVDLGTDTDDPAEVLYGMLLSLNVDSSQIPKGLNRRLGMYQSVTRGLALLVVIDGVVSEGQASRFRPASPASGYLVVGQPLQDASFARHEVGPLEPGHAAEFLRRACPNLVEGAPERLVAELGSKPADLSALAKLVRHRSLTGLFEVREALGGSSLFTGIYDSLSESAKWLHRMLESLPNREFEGDLTQIFEGSVDWTKGALDPFSELEALGLVKSHRPGWYRLEYQITGVGGRHARIGAVRSDVHGSVRDALIWHIRRAQLADHAIMKARMRFAPPLPRHIAAKPFTGEATAIEWFRTLYPVLHRSLLVTAKQRLHTDLTWALAEALWAFYANASRYEDAAEAYRAARAVADGPHAEAHLSSLLAMCLIRIGGFDEAEQVLDHAMEALESAPPAADRAEAVDRTRLKGIVTEAFGRLRQGQGRFDDARDVLLRSCEYMAEAGESRAVGIRLRVIAETYQAEGRFEDAVATWTQAAEQFDPGTDWRNRNGALLDIAMLRLRRGDTGVVPEIDDLLKPFEQGGYWQTVAETHERVAEATGEDGNPDRDRLERALRLFGAHGAVLDAARVRQRLGLNGSGER